MGHNYMGHNYIGRNLLEEVRDADEIIGNLRVETCVWAWHALELKHVCGRGMRHLRANGRSGRGGWRG